VARCGCANQLEHLGLTSYKDQVTKAEEAETQKAKRSPTVSLNTKTLMEHFTRSQEKGELARTNKGNNMNTLKEKKQVYIIYDNNGNFFQYIKVSELCGAVNHFLNVDKKVTIEEDYISKELYNKYFN
jgi:hypothetical protein